MNLPRLDKKKILITGGLGFIGSNLAKACLELGAQVTIYDSLDPKTGGNISNIKDFKNEVEDIRDDIRHFEALSKAIAHKDIVFNCAAYASHPNSMKEPLIDIEVNCQGVIHVLEAARLHAPHTKLVHVGTSTQIGKMHSSPIDEWHPEFPLDIYSANKSASEKYVLLYSTAYNFMDTTVVRLANTFGPRAAIKTPEFGFINYFIGLGLQNKEIPVYGNGSQMRNFCYVEDSVRALILAAVHPKTNGEVFFAVTNEQYTVKQVAEEISRIIGGHVTYIPWPKDREAIEIGDAVISNKKIKEHMGWTAKYDLASGLQHAKDYFHSRLADYL
jgi:UDP-glucose 4-epimerase